MKQTKLILSIFVMLLCSLLIAQDKKNIVSSVEVKGLLTVGEDFVKSKLKTQPRTPFSPEDLKDDIRNLHQLGLFSNIEANVQETISGIKVTFLIVENQILGEVYIVGNNQIETDELKKKLKIVKERYLAPYILSVDRIDLQDHYNKEGFVFAKIETKVKPSGSWADVYFFVEEGPKVYVSKIHFFGNKSFRPGELTQFTTTQASGFLNTNYFNETALNEDLILIRNFYRSEGFLDAVVELRDLVFSEDREKVTVNINVIEGPLYHINKVIVTGQTILTEDELFERVFSKEKKPFKQNQMLEDKKRVERIYGELGFLNVRVETRITLPDLESHTVDITYEIKEGVKTYVNKIDIIGNRLTRDDVVRRELSINPGDQFNIAKVEDSQQRLQRLQFFESMKMELGTTEELSWKDIILRLEEGSTGNVRFAAGITSDLGAVGEVSLTKRNFDIADVPTSFEDLISGDSFTGAGQLLDIQLQIAQDIIRYDVTFTEPQIFGYNLLFSVKGFKRERGFEGFDEERTGATISFGRRLTLDTTLRFNYTLQEVDINDLDNDAPQDVVDVEGRNVLSSLEAQIVVDTTDSFILPSRGYIFDIGYELTGTVLGGDHDFSKINLRLAWFQTLYTNSEGGKHILAVGTRLGFANAHPDSKRVPIFERFFAGGGSSVRGFELRTVGPIDVVSDDPLGGEFLITNTIEYSFPLYEDIFRGVLFCDTGNVTASIYDDATQELRVTVGLGFRLKIPLLGPRPLAFDFGFPIREEDGDDKQIFSFSLGKPF